MPKLPPSIVFVFLRKRVAVRRGFCEGGNRGRQPLATSYWLLAKNQKPRTSTSLPKARILSVPAFFRAMGWKRGALRAARPRRPPARFGRLDLAVDSEGYLSAVVGFEVLDVASWRNAGYFGASPSSRMVASFFCCSGVSTLEIWDLALAWISCALAFCWSGLSDVSFFTALSC